MNRKRAKKLWLWRKQYAKATAVWWLRTIESRPIMTYDDKMLVRAFRECHRSS